MNISYKSIAWSACFLFAASTFVSCVAEDPFEHMTDGNLRLKMVINSDITRAETDVTDLAASTVLYISNEKGLIRKFQGQENIPDRIPLKGGTYLAEAWAGDSVSASFDKKFYQGQTRFEISGADTEVTLTCGIANVVASVNKNSAEAINVPDLKVTVSHSRGSLDFTAENFDAKGYFMMPNADKDLDYTITGTNADGNPFSVSGVISDVKKGHEYILNISDNPTYDEIGGAFLNVTIDDREILVESEVTLYGRPTVKGVGFDISKQVFANAGKFNDISIQIKAFGGLKSLILATETASELNLPSSDLDIINITDPVRQELNAKGIDWEIKPVEGKNYVIAYLNFHASYLNSLLNGAYEILLTAHDSYGKFTSERLRIGVGEGSQVIDDPVLLDEMNGSDLTNLSARRAVITGTLVSPESNPAIQYRESGTSSWNSASLENVAAVARRSPSKAAGQKFKVTLRSLKPGTRYEYRAVADEFQSESMFFTTESEFSFPNASFEEWSTYSASTLLGKKTVIFPGSGNQPTFWDSGNEGGATADKVLTNMSTNMIHSGTYSARLASTSAFMMLAAGNIFAGDYVKTDGTNGVLSLGREYNGSHPDKLAVWANYRPGIVDQIKSGNESYLDFTKGQNDHGQIYVALTTAPIEIRTNPSNQKLFPADGVGQDADKVIAYGQVTWKEAFGPDGALQRIEIPLTYFDRARTTKPLYVVVVCCASKFGDFFSGSSSSVLYLDDFEFVYE